MTSEDLARWERDTVSAEFLAQWEAECALVGSYLPSQVDRAAGAWVHGTIDEARDDGAETDCPFCEDGLTTATRFDATGDVAATLVAYGIGDGLHAAERWAEGSLDAMRALLAEVRRQRARIDELETALSVELEDGARLKAAIESIRSRGVTYLASGWLAVEGVEKGQHFTEFWPELLTRLRQALDGAAP